MTATMCLSGAVLLKAGTNVSSNMTGVDAETNLNKFIEEAEAFITNLLKYDAVTNWNSLNAVYKLLFTEYCARSAAIQAITYDMSGYTDGIEAENMIKIHWQRCLDIQKLLEDSSIQDFQGTNS